MAIRCNNKILHTLFLETMKNHVLFALNSFFFLPSPAFIHVQFTSLHTYVLCNRVAQKKNTSEISSLISQTHSSIENWRQMENRGNASSVFWRLICYQFSSSTTIENRLGLPYCAWIGSSRARVHCKYERLMYTSEWVNAFLLLVISSFEHIEKYHTW